MWMYAGGLTGAVAALVVFVKLLSIEREKAYDLGEMIYWGTPVIMILGALVGVGLVRGIIWALRKRRKPFLSDISHGYVVCPRCDFIQAGSLEKCQKCGMEFTK